MSTLLHCDNYVTSNNMDWFKIDTLLEYVGLDKK